MRCIRKTYFTMKRILFFAAAMLLALSCATKKADAPKALVLYYSQTGTTEKVALAIAEKTGADVEAIVAVNPYDGDYNATIQRGLQEMQDGVYPELQPLTSNIADYDVVFIGYPVWFGTYAPPVETLLGNEALKGKKIVPFCTFGSGGLDTSSNAIAAKLTESEVLPGYGVRAARIDAIDAELDQFLKAGGYAEGEAVAVEAYPEAVPVTEEQAAIFNAAVASYAMIQAEAETVASRTHFLGGQEYLFTAKDVRNGAEMKINVLVEEGKEPVFTQVYR